MKFKLFLLLHDEPSSKVHYYMFYNACSVISPQFAHWYPLLNLELFVSYLIDTTTMFHLPSCYYH
jgi:hypothetical protein